MIKKLAFLAVIITYMLIVFGGYVATSESGMGCGPEWPLCNGEVIPELQGETLIEFAHRFIGLLLVIVVAALFIQIQRTSSNTSLHKASRWMISLLTIQVFAGAVVVILDLPAIVVTLHLIVAMLFLFNLLWIYRAADQTSRGMTLSGEKQKSIVTHLNLLNSLLLVTIGLGAYIKHQQYGLACDWLDCRGTWLPANFPQILQTLHRVLALITASYTLWIASFAFLKNWGAKLKRRLLLAAGLVLVQLISGILTVMTTISVPWAVIHLAVGTALFMAAAESRIQVGVSVVVIDKGRRFYQTEEFENKY